MNAWLTILGIVLGWALKEFSDRVRSKREDLRTNRRVIAELVPMYDACVELYTWFKSAHENHAIADVERLRHSYAMLISKKLEPCIARVESMRQEVAGCDPILAVELDSLVEQCKTLLGCNYPNSDEVSISYESFCDISAKFANDVIKRIHEVLVPLSEKTGVDILSRVVIKSLKTMDGIIPELPKIYGQMNDLKKSKAITASPISNDPNS
jgi:hypothetical protein